MKYVKKKLSEIRPYENNPRNNDDAVEAVAASIREFGFKVPIIIDENGVIIAGHTRLKAAQRLGMEKVPVIKADDLTEQQVRAFRLADNKVAELATWDLDKLETELEEITDLDMMEFGFEGEEEEKEETAGGEENEYPEKVKSRCKPGDIWILGRHRLICGDSTDERIVEKLMNGQKADVVFTDPPYGMNLDTDYSSMKNHLDFAKGQNLNAGKKYEQGKVDEFKPEMIKAAMRLDAKETFLWGRIITRNYWKKRMRDPGSFGIKERTEMTTKRKIIKATKCMDPALNCVGAKRNTNGKSQE